MSKKVLPFSGMKDASGDDARWRLAVLDEIRQVFELFGFEPLITPEVERWETLTGKYGAEAESLLFRLGPPFEDGALRYDLTVPLARVAAANWQELPKPYRRYAIGPVFRGERAQAGRYRAFTQCDFDTLGSSSPLVDAEVVAINAMVLNRLGFEGRFVVNVNDRRLLNAMVGAMGPLAAFPASILRAWDKLDKVPLTESYEYLVRDIGDAGPRHESIIARNYMPRTDEILRLLRDGAGVETMLSTVSREFPSTEVDAALRDLEVLISQIRGLGVEDAVFRFNPLLARGLSYYTGPIFETTTLGVNLGSITGGGRYDELIQKLGGPSVPACGSSFGVERLLDVMEKMSLRPNSSQKTQVFVTIFDQQDQHLTAQTLYTASQLRDLGVCVEVYSGDQVKLGKQFAVANKKGIPLVIVIGPADLDVRVLILRDLRTGQESAMSLETAARQIASLV